MSLNGKFEETREQRAGQGRQDRAELPDAELEQALKNFRHSVHAWSEAELSRPRTVKMSLRRRSWRLAVGWALGLALVVGGASGALYERHHQAELARIKAMQDAEHQRQMAAERVKDADEELAKVDSDVSRDVPSAMEPLAQLMGEDQSR